MFLIRVTISVIIVAEKPIITADEAADMDREVVSIDFFIFLMFWGIMYGLTTFTL